MSFDAGILAALISGAVAIAIAVVGGGIAIFARQRAMETKIDANHAHAETRFDGTNARLDLMERDLGKIDQVAGDVAYIRGFLDAARQPRRTLKTPQ